MFRVSTITLHTSLLITIGSVISNWSPKSPSTMPRLGTKSPLVLAPFHILFLNYRSRKKGFFTFFLTNSTGSMISCITEFLESYDISMPAVLLRYTHTFRPNRLLNFSSKILNTPASKHLLNTQIYFKPVINLIDHC